MMVGAPVVISMDMPVMLNCDAESLTVNVKLGEVPDPEAGKRNRPWARPRDGPVRPPWTKPELTMVSDASR